MIQTRHGYPQTKWQVFMEVVDDLTSLINFVFSVLFLLRFLGVI